MALGIGKGGELNVVLRVKDDGSVAVRKFGDNAETGFSKAERGAQRTGRALSGMQRTLVAAVTTMVSFAAARKFVDAFKEQEQAVAALDASIASMGRTTEGLSGQLQTLASQVQRDGIIGDEALIKGQSFLSTYSKITDDLLPRTTWVMADLAAKMGGDTVQAANLLGKASMGMTGELARIGITLSDATKESKDFEAIISEIEQQVGGMNAALGRTATGGIQQFSNAWGDVQEQLGRVIAMSISPFLREIARDLEITDQQTQIWVDNTIAGMGAVGFTVAHLGNAYVGLKEIFLALQITSEELKLKVLEGLGLMSEGAIKFRSIFRDISEEEQRGLLQNEVTLATTRSGIAALKLELSELAHGEMPTEKWDAFMGRIIESVAEFRANVVTNAGAGTGEEAGGLLSDAILGDVDNDLEKLRVALADKLYALDESYLNERDLLANDYLEKQFLLEEALEADAQSHEKYYERRAALDVWYSDQKAKLDDKDLKRTQAVENSVRAIRQQTFNHGLELLNALAVHSKAAALVALALQKGLAIAETIVNTKVAQMRALAELGPIAGPPMAAAIGAWGAASVALIAATGLVQAAGILGGDAPTASPVYSADPGTANPTTEPVSSVEQGAVTTTPRVVNIVIDSDRMITTNWVRDELIPELNSAVGDGVVLRVSA